MTPTAALARGIAEAWLRSRVLLGLFVLNVVWATGATWPFFVQLRRVTERSTAAAVLERGVQFDVLAEILTRHPALVSAATAAIAVALVGWLFLAPFLCAGLIGALLEPRERATLRRFVVAAAGCGPALLRLQALSLIPYAVVALAALLVSGLAGVLASLGGRPGPVVAAVIGGAVPGVALALCVAGAVDLARVRLVRDGERRAWRSLAGALREALQRPWRYARLQLLSAFAWVGLTILSFALASLSPYAFAGGLVLLSIVRQAVVLGRLSVRAGTLAATALLDEGEARLAEAGAAPVAGTEGEEESA